MSSYGGDLYIGATLKTGSNYQAKLYKRNYTANSWIEVGSEPLNSDSSTVFRSLQPSLDAFLSFGVRGGSSTLSQLTSPSVVKELYGLVLESFKPYFDSRLYFASNNNVTNSGATGENVSSTSPYGVSANFDFDLFSGGQSPIGASDFTIYQGQLCIGRDPANGDPSNHIYCRDPWSNVWTEVGAFHSLASGAAVRTLATASCATPVVKNAPYHISATQTWNSGVSVTHNLGLKLSTYSSVQDSSLKTGACYQPTGTSLGWSGSQTGKSGQESITMDFTNSLYGADGPLFDTFKTSLIYDLYDSWSLSSGGQTNAQSGDFTLTIRGLRGSDGYPSGDDSYICHSPQTTQCSQQAIIGSLIYYKGDGSSPWNAGANMSFTTAYDANGEICRHI